MLDRWNTCCDTWRSTPVHIQCPNTSCPGNSAGQHAVVYEMVTFNAQHASAHLTWEHSSSHCAPGQFWQQLFNTTDFSGTGARQSATSCIDGSNGLDINWGRSAPPELSVSDHFSARWSGEIPMTTGMYTFTARADDHIRLYVNGTLVLDRMHQCCTTWHSAAVYIDTVASIMLEYHENSATAYCSLSWSPFTCPDNQFLTSFFDNPAFAGVPAAVTCESFPINHAWDQGGVSELGGQASHFSVRWTGWFDFPATTTGSSTSYYTFTAASGTAGTTPSASRDGGSRVSLDGRIVLNKLDTCCSTWTSQPILVSPGRHQLTFEMVAIGSNGYASIFWSQPLCGSATLPACIQSISTTSSCPDTMPWLATYFPNTNTTPPFQYAACEPHISRAWSSAGVDELRRQADHYSIRWTAQPPLVPGTYEFQSYSNDGSRIYVDNTMILDRWSSCCDSWVSTPTSVHTDSVIVYEMVNFGGSAAAELSWLNIACGPNVFDVDFFPCLGFNCPPVATVTPTCMLPADIGFDSANHPLYSFDSRHSPAQLGSRRDRFTVRFSGDFVFTGGTGARSSGMYTFTVASDDGSRVILDGVTIMDNWNHVVRTPRNSDAVYISPGRHVIVFEVQERRGAFNAALAWSRLDSCPPNTMQVKFWDNPDFRGLVNATCEQSGTPCSNVACTPVNRQWVTTGPPEIAPQTTLFTARWEGTFEFDAGEYVFTATADDSVRILVDGVMVLDHWSDCCSAWSSNPVYLSAGQHAIAYEYVQYTGTAYAMLSWAQPSPVQALCPQGQLAGLYYANAALHGTPANSSCAAPYLSRDGTTWTGVDVDWGTTGVPGLHNQNDHFSVRWTGNILFDPAGTYTFTLSSDDGSRLFVDGLMVLDRWAHSNGGTWVSDAQPLLGWHEITYEYVALYGSAYASLSWSYQPTVNQSINQGCSYGDAIPDVLLPTCARRASAQGCMQFSHLQAAKDACSLDSNCAGITYEDQQDTSVCCDNDGPHAGTCGWCFEMRGSHAQTVATGKTSWLKQPGTCSDIFDGQLGCGSNITGSTTNAGNHLGNAASDHIFRLTLTQSTVVRLSTCGSNYDTYLRVYNLDMTQQLHYCDDCGPCGLQTVLDTQLDAGDYAVVLEGYSSREGTYHLTVECMQPSAPLAIVCDDVVHGNTDSAVSNHGGQSGEHLYDFTLTEPINLVQFDSCGSQFDTCRLSDIRRTPKS